MQQHTTPRPASSSPTWENLETWVREQSSRSCRPMLKAEIADLVGRDTSAGTPSTPRQATATATASS